MKKKSKLITILKAFTEDIDTTPELYQERLDTCGTCEYSSGNIEDTDLKVKQKLTINTVCQGSPICTACGCCILKKAGQKTETCGATEIGVKPKWHAVKVETSRDKELDIELLNNSAESIKLTEKGDGFVVDLGDVPSGVHQVEMLVTRKSGLNISSVRAGCSCTVPTQEKIDENNIRLVAKINTIGFTKDMKFSKKLTVYYFESKLGTKTAVINLTGVRK